jgi:hypothetical protein
MEAPAPHPPNHIPGGGRGEEGRVGGPYEKMPPALLATLIFQPIVMFQKYLKKMSSFFVAAGFSLRSFFLIISQGKACGYIFNAYK